MRLLRDAAPATAAWSSWRGLRSSPPRGCTRASARRRTKKEKELRGGRELGIGLHPTTEGYDDMAASLYGELGFSPLAASVTDCSPLRLRVSGAPRRVERDHPSAASINETTGGRLGATPGGEVVLFFRRRAPPLADAGGSLAPQYMCRGRGLMLSPDGLVDGFADEAGEASMLAPGVSCGAAQWQLLDVSSCLASRLIN